MTRRPLMDDNTRLQLLDRLLDSPLPEVQRAATQVALLAHEAPLQKRRLFAAAASGQPAVQLCITAAIDGRLALPADPGLLDEAREDLDMLRLHLTERAYGMASPAQDEKAWTPGLQRALAETLTGAAYDERDAMLTFGERTGFASTQRVDGARVLVEDYSDATTNPVMVATEAGRASGFASLIEAEDRGRSRVVLDRNAAAMLRPIRDLQAQLLDSFLLLDSLDYDPFDAVWESSDDPDRFREVTDEAWRLAIAPVPEPDDPGQLVGWTRTPGQVGGADAPVVSTFSDAAKKRARRTSAATSFEAAKNPRRVVPASDAYRTARGWRFPCWTRSSWALSRRAAKHTPIGGLTAATANGEAYLSLDAQDFADSLRYGARVLGTTATPQVVALMRGIQRARFQHGR